jgi:hypothetical protein
MVISLFLPLAGEVNKKVFNGRGSDSFASFVPSAQKSDEAGEPFGYSITLACFLRISRIKLILNTKGRLLFSAPSRQLVATRTPCGGVVMATGSHALWVYNIRFDPCAVGLIFAYTAALAAFVRVDRFFIIVVSLESYRLIHCRNCGSGLKCVSR